MSDFAVALKSKIDDLKKERLSLEEQIKVLDSKLSVLLELWQEESGQELSSAAPKKKAGRPKGSGKKSQVSTPPQATKPGHQIDPELLREAEAHLKIQGGGTDPAKAKEIARKFNPMPRTTNDYGQHVRIQSRSKINRKLAGEEEED